MPFSLHHIKGTYYQHDLGLFVFNLSPGWDSVCQISLLSSYFFLPSSHCALWKTVAMCSLHLRSRQLCSVSFRVEHIHKLFGILREIFLFCPFIYLFIQSLISVWTQILFYTLGYNPTLLTFLVQIFVPWPLALFQFGPWPFSIPPPTHQCGRFF